MYQIKQLTQTKGDNCVATCIAMATGMPLDLITEEFHEDYQKGKNNISEYLKNLPITMNCRDILTKETRMFRGFVYFLAVPSLNYLGAMHMVLLDYRDNPVVYDPNYEKPGAKVYSWQSDAVDYRVKGFSIEVEIINFDVWHDVASKMLANHK